MTHINRTAVAALAFLSLGHATAHATDDGSFRMAQACGHYVILGCFRALSAAQNRLAELGGPGVGGGAGTRVIDTDEYPNFSAGWFCVADGPYASKAGAMSIAWKEAVSDAYVKNGC
jgi:hypothetical protein